MTSSLALLSVNRYRKACIFKLTRRPLNSNTSQFIQGKMGTRSSTNLISKIKQRNAKPKSDTLPSNALGPISPITRGSETPSPYGKERSRSKAKKAPSLARYHQKGFWAFGLYFVPVLSRFIRQLPNRLVFRSPGSAHLLLKARTIHNCDRKGPKRAENLRFATQKRIPRIFPGVGLQNISMKDTGRGTSQGSGESLATEIKCLASNVIGVAMVKSRNGREGSQFPLSCIFAGYNAFHYPKPLLKKGGSDRRRSRFCKGLVETYKEWAR